MKINIFFNFRSHIFGGGNQFLKTLKNEFVRQGTYEENPAQAEIILFNSHHQLAGALKMKYKNPEKAMVHRLGPVFHYHRGKRWERYDKTIINLTNKISDGVIFQSESSFQQAIELGFNKSMPKSGIYTEKRPPAIRTAIKIKAMAAIFLSCFSPKDFDSLYFSCLIDIIFFILLFDNNIFTNLCPKKH